VFWIGCKAVSAARAKQVFAHRSGSRANEHLRLLGDLLGEGDVGGLEEGPHRARRDARAKHEAEGQVEQEGGHDFEFV
jgi:hypothetical protein